MYFYIYLIIMNNLATFFSRSSQFKHIAEKMFANNYKIDHYAYRSFNMQDILAKYPNYHLEKEKYDFNNNVKARWLSNKNEPFIFVSQYQNPKNDSLINKNHIDISKLNYFIKTNSPPDYKFYQEVKLYNHYLAWTLLFNNQINHVAFLVEDINKCYENIDNNFKMYEINNINDPIQVSNDGNLKQFSIKAEQTKYNFSDGTYDVPYTFIEFVERQNGRRGFEGNNAAKIFDSTKK